jgi:2-hydroxychromene-2-carboxylate isomerase
MIEFFFDCSSPWTYLAFHNIQPLAQEFGQDISWRPILVGGIFNTINPSVYASREHPVAAKVEYQKKDMVDWAREGHGGLGALGGADDQNAAEGVPGE